MLGPDYYDKEYFDGGKGYHTYADATHFFETAQMIKERFSPKSVLELGCAKGYLVKALRSLGVSAFGLDVSGYAIDNADEEVKPYLTVLDFTAESATNRYDLIVSIDTFEHIPEEKLESVKKFLLATADRYYIKVATPHTPDWEHDKSHVTIKELSWWQEWMPEAHWEESK